MLQVNGKIFSAFEEDFWEKAFQHAIKTSHFNNNNSDISESPRFSIAIENFKSPISRRLFFNLWIFYENHMIGALLFLEAIAYDQQINEYEKTKRLCMLTL